MKFNSTFRILILALLAGVSFAWQHSRAADSPQRIEIVAKRFEFSPSEITLKKGEPVIIVLTTSSMG
jgi:cytochrome c oxidase subunit 2